MYFRLHKIVQAHPLQAGKVVGKEQHSLLLQVPEEIGVEPQKREDSWVSL